jgi:hypothetical protein
MFADTTHHCADGERVTNFAQCITTQMHHYVTTNGRFAVHVVVMALLNLVPLWVYRLLNAIMFGLLWLLATRFSAPQRRTNTVCAVAWLLLFVALPQPGLVLLTLVSYAVNYLWVGVAVLALLLWLQRSPHSRWLIVYALFVGTLQESFSLPLCAGLVVAAICRRVPIAVVAAFIVGTAVEVFAPGNMAHAAQGGGFSIAAVAAKLSALGHDLCFSLITYATIAALIWLAVRRRACIAFVKDNVLLVVSIYAALALAALTFTSPRQLTAPTLFTIVLLLKRVPSRRWLTAVSVAAVVAVMAPMAVYKYQIYERYQTVLQSVSSGARIAQPQGRTVCTLNNSITRAFIPDPLCNRGLVAVGDKYTKTGLRRLYNDSLTTILPARTADIVAATHSASAVTADSIVTAPFGPFEVMAIPRAKYAAVKSPKGVPYEQFAQCDIIYRIVAAHK